MNRDKIRFDCEQCHSRVRTLESNAGKKGRCPKCGFINTVPTTEEQLLSEVKDLLWGEEVPTDKDISFGSGGTWIINNSQKM